MNFFTKLRKNYFFVKKLGETFVKLVLSANTKKKFVYGPNWLKVKLDPANIYTYMKIKFEFDGPQSKDKKKYIFSRSW